MRKEQYQKCKKCGQTMTGIMVALYDPPIRTICESCDENIDKPSAA